MRAVPRLARLWWRGVRADEHVFLLFAALLVGGLCGLGALGLHTLIELGHRLFWGSESGAVPPAGAPFWLVLLAPAVGGLLVGPLVRWLAPEAGGHGVPEVIRAVAEKQGRMRPRVAVVKAVASALTISSGGSAGREGPIIQIGATLGSAVGQLFRVSGRQLRILAGCGAAAGIAATFNAPIAGTLFAVEVILGEFGILPFSPIVIAAVIATVVARGSWGNEPVFHVPPHELGGPIELAAYAALGLVCGLVSVLFIRTARRVERAFSAERRVPAWLKPAAGGLLVGVMGLWLPRVFGDGYATVNDAFAGGLAWWLLVLLLVGKMLATSLTLGSGGSGGVFAPALFLGAVAGALVGSLIAQVPGLEGTQAGAFALVGMGGLVAGAMHAPITAMVMCFELTNHYSLILPIMLVCTLSTLLSNRLQRDSIYTWHLRELGVRLFRGRSLEVFREQPVRACMRSAPAMLPATISAADALGRLVDGFSDTLYLAAPEGRLAGALYLADLKAVLTKRDQLRSGFLAVDLARENLPVCHPADPLRIAMARLLETGLPELPVVDPATGRLVGVVRHDDAVALYHRELIQQEAADAIAQRV